MSTCEYNNLFLRCQHTGKYQVFIFDIVNSKLLSVDKRRNIQLKLILLAEKMYQKILEFESKTNKKILVFDDDFVYLTDNNKTMGFGLKTEPFVLGDMFGFTVYRDSLDKAWIFEVFNNLKFELEIDVEFHVNTGYYETNNYGLGNELYFRGYCIDLVANLHKKKYASLVRKLTYLSK